MNLVILNDFGFVNGGAAQVAINSALMMAQKGHKVYYVCAVYPIDERLRTTDNLFIICTNQNDILNNKNRLQSSLQGLWNVQASKVVNDLLKTLPLNDTIVHVHGWTKALSHSSIYPAIKRNFKIILSLHDYFISCPNGGFYNYQKQMICPLRALSPECILTHCDSRNYKHKIWRVIRAFMQKHIVRIPSRINYFISMSSLSTSVIKSYLPLNAKIFLLPNAIDFQKPERVKAEENHQFFAVGRLSPEKGFNLVAKATRNLEIEISFIGDGPEKERLAQINPSAHFYGWLPRHELATKLRLARAIIFSSKWYETQGLIISEAVSHGIPCIVSDSSAGRESIIDHQTGLLFTSNDEEDLSEKIKHLQTDDNVKFLSINAYDQFWSNPNIIEIYSNKIEEIYISILEHEKVK